MTILHLYYDIICYNARILRWSGAIGARWAMIPTAFKPHVRFKPYPASAPHLPQGETDLSMSVTESMPNSIRDPCIRLLRTRNRAASEPATLFNLMFDIDRARRLLLHQLELIGTDSANGAHEVLGQLGSVDLDLVAADDAHELVGLLVSHGNHPFVGDETYPLVYPPRAISNGTTRDQGILNI